MIGDLIFIIGGWNERGDVVVEEVEVMSTKTQTMETFTRIPTGRRGLGVGVVERTTFPNTTINNNNK